LKARARLIWPALLHKPEGIAFPLTQVGNFSVGEILLSNPSSRDVSFHLVPMSAYPSGAKVAGLLPARCHIIFFLSPVLSVSHPS
jgi:hypothetical protein